MSKKRRVRRMKLNPSQRATLNELKSVEEMLRVMYPRRKSYNSTSGAEFSKLLLRKMELERSLP
jgi:hypothetical protein